MKKQLMLFALSIITSFCIASDDLEARRFANFFNEGDLTPDDFEAKRFANFLKGNKSTESDSTEYCFPVTKHLLVDNANNILNDYSDHKREISDSGKVVSFYYFFHKNGYNSKSYVFKHLDLRFASAFKLNKNPSSEEISELGALCKKEVKTINGQNASILSNCLSFFTFTAANNYPTPKSFIQQLENNKAILETQIPTINIKTQQLNQEKFSLKSVIGLPVLTSFFAGGATVLANSFLGTTINPVKTGSVGAAITSTYIARYNAAKEHEKKQLQKQIKLNGATVTRIQELINYAKEFDEKKIADVNRYSR